MISANGHQLGVEKTPTGVFCVVQSTLNAFRLKLESLVAVVQIKLEIC